MLANTLRIFFMLAFATSIGVSQQAPTACIVQCSNAALSSSTSGCTTYNPPACICNDQGFQQAVTTCINDTCPGDMPVALQLQSQNCPSS
ncbi:hypothetical protein BC827DRAFT_1235540 [Russula dissimulans]|nr:hypothetical protein BC827DRAFT_1235540 [Russula dissimulans]